jgi:RHS repeat-associated protein
MKLYLRCWFVCATFLLSSFAAFGQVSTGMPPLGSFSSGPDVINLGNLNSHFAIPVFSKPGRGTSFDYILSFDTSIWTPSATGWTPVDNWGWRNISEVATGFLTRDSTNEECGLIATQLSPQVVTTKPRFFNFQYHDRFGVIHSFANTAGGCPGDGIDNVSTSQDASGDSLDTTTSGKWTITTTDGHSFKPPIGSTAGAGTFTDRNGNQISTTGNTFTDTLGMTALTVTGTAPSPTVFTYTTSSGTNASVTMNYTSYTVETAFECAGIAEYPATAVNLVSSVVLPDGSSYSFQYEPTPGHAGDVTGRVSEITLRTGGTIGYAYTGGSNGIECADGSTAGLSRTTFDGTTHGTSTYSRAVSGTASTTTVSDASSTPNKTVISFQTAGTPANFFETHRTVNQGDSTPLINTDACYNTAVEPNCSTTAISLPISEIKSYTTLINGNQSMNDTKLNSFGLIQEVDEYDFGATAPGTLLRKTLTTYASLGNGIVGLPATIAVQDGSGIQKAQQSFGYDETAVTGTTGVPQHVAISGSRGNQTTLTQWVNSTPTTLASIFTYDDTGNMLTSKDPKGNQAQFSYADNFSDSINRGSLAYLTQVTQPNTGVSHVTKTQYDPNTGLKMTTWDLNNNPTTYTYDALLRPLRTNYPDGGQTANTYTSPTSSTQNVKLSSSQTVTGVTVLDGMGRISQEQLSSDPSGATVTDAVYDGNGLLVSASNPHRSAGNTTDGTRQMIYDALGRITQLTQPDLNTITVSYSNNCTTITDETTKLRKVCTDSLGRVTSSYEPDNTGVLNWETDTTYDALNNATGITQKGGVASGQWRTRIFTYDGLSRMTVKSEPESGTTNLYYTTAAGALCAGSTTLQCRITDARTITRTYAYDALNRLSGKTYSDSTPSVTYSYDQTSFNGLTIANGNGVRTGMTDGSGLTAWSFDSMGRTVTRKQTIASVTKSIGYTYNLDGSAATMTYPSGRVYTYGYNNAAETTSIADTTNSINFFTSGQYAPSGLLTGGIHGATTGWNAITLANTYNSRLQPTQFLATSPLPSTLLKLIYSYDQGAGKNNGDVVQITNGRDSTRTTAYTYDQVNRLSTAQTPSAPTWGDSYTYDAWGNLTQKTVTKGTAETMSLLVNSNNQIYSPAFTYDAAGNVTYDTSVHMVYDAEGRMNPSSGTTYTYDGDGRRVEKSDGTVYWVDDNFHPLSIGTTSGSLTKDFVFLGDKRVAFVSLSAGNVYYYLSDQIGSTAVIGSGDGKTIQWEADYFPFGAERQVFTSSVNNIYQFTGYEYDSDTQYNYALARFDAGRWGRFLTPDPYLGSIDITNPQSLNRYSYVLDNPTNLDDPLGLECQMLFTPDGTPYMHCDSNAPMPGDPTPSGNGSGFAGGKHPPLQSDSPTGPSVRTRANKILQCASKLANQFSIAGLIGVDESKHPFLASITNAVGGNSISGLVDFGSHLLSGQNGATMGDLALGGASQGLPIGGSGLSSKGLAGLATDAAIDAVSQPGEVLSITGAATQLGEEGLAGPIGLAKLGIDGAIFAASAAYCAKHL